MIYCILYVSHVANREIPQIVWVEEQEPGAADEYARKLLRFGYYLKEVLPMSKGEELKRALSNLKISLLPVYAEERKEKAA